MKHHLFLGEFEYNQLVELVEMLEVQETTDRDTSSTTHMSGQYGDYWMRFDADGNCEISHA